jgi:hypothetical protein
MNARILLGLAAALWLLPACSRKPIPTDTSQAADIPKEIAVQKLKEMLPGVSYVYCTEPKDSLKPSEIRSMSVSMTGIEVVRAKGAPLPLLFKDIRLVQAATSGTRAAVCRIFTVRQPQADKAHFEFLFPTITQAQQMTELVTALRRED